MSAGTLYGGGYDWDEVDTLLFIVLLLLFRLMIG
jgi:hypothetical protein